MDRPIRHRFTKPLLTTLISIGVLSLAACGGGGGGSSTTSRSSTGTSVSLSGTVSAPTDSTTFASLNLWQRVLASLSPAPAVASTGSFTPVTGGVTVAVYQVNPDGSLASTTPLATTTTDSTGAYKLSAVIDTTNMGAYIVRVTGSSGSMESRITGTTVNIDPTTDAASKLVAYAAAQNGSTTLKPFTPLRIALLEAEVADMMARLDTTGLNAGTLSTDIVAAAKEDEELASLIVNQLAPGQICGTVADQSGNPLTNVVVVVRDYGQWVTRSRARTDSTGHYCAPIGYGNYIVGAMNRGADAKLSASGWYNASGLAYSQIEAGKVSVTSGSPLFTANFTLPPGGRLAGTVTAATGGALPGVLVMARDFRTLYPVAFVRTALDGSYAFNLPAGHSYAIVARNDTWAPFASQVDTTDATNDNNINYATNESITLAKTTLVSFALAAGNLLHGTVTDSNGPVPGTKVRVDVDSGGQPSGWGERLRTDLQGRYALWVKPGFYDVWSHGQRTLGVDLTTGNTAVNFTQDVAPVTATITDGAGNPVSQAKVMLVDAAATGSTSDIWADADSNGDGTVRLFALPGGTGTGAGGNGIPASYAAIVMIDDNRGYGSAIYSNKLSVADAASGGSALTLATTTPLALGTVALPGGGLLTGTVTTDGTTPAPNVPVQVRYDGSSYPYRLVTTRTRGDGSYALSVPAATYSGIRFNGNSGALCGPVTTTAGATTTKGFITGTATVSMACN